MAWTVFSYVLAALGLCLLCIFCMLVAALAWPRALRATHTQTHTRVDWQHIYALERELYNGHTFHHYGAPPPELPPGYADLSMIRDLGIRYGDTVRYWVEQDERKVKVSHDSATDPRD